MLDYGNTISLAEGDWLSVAARANDAMGQDAVDNVTVLLRIRGSDLHALRVGSLSRDEARRRGGEEQGRVGEVRRVGDPAERRDPGDRLGEVVDVAESAGERVSELNAEITVEMAMVIANCL